MKTPCMNRIAFSYQIAITFFLLLLYSANAQNGLNNRNCAECPVSTSFGPDQVTQILSPGGCLMTITYATRQCMNFYDVAVRSVQVSGSACDSVSSEFLVNEACMLLIFSNPMHFPPYTSSSSAGWRMVRASCWSKGPTGFTPCPSAPCCEVQIGVAANGCGSTMHFPSNQVTRWSDPCGPPAPGSPGECFFVCDPDMFQTYMKHNPNQSTIQP